MLEGMFIALRGLWLVLVEHQLDSARRMLADAGLLTDERQLELDAIREKLLGLNLPSVDDLRNDWEAAEARGRARVTGPAPTIVVPDPEVIEVRAEWHEAPEPGPAPVPVVGEVVARRLCPGCEGNGGCDVCGGQGLV